MRLLFLCLALALSARSALAWSGAGHMVIAAEAYRELSPKMKARANTVLKAHPEYEKWQSSFFSDSPTLDLGTYIFMRASVWPDEIRRKGNPYDHPQWHYINYPLQPPRFPFEPGSSPTNDILYGIEQAEKGLSARHESAELRAVYLSWLIHLIGDLHQPLHCSTLVNQTFPEGDKGGNDFYVKPAEKGIRLHSFWDGLLGTRSHPQSEVNDAIRLASEFPRKSLPELKRSTPRKWSLDSRSLAIEKAYLHEELKGSTSPDIAPGLPEGYTKEAKAVAERQAALAGYRLADEVKKYLK
jgi:hypothetical protein